MPKNSLSAGQTYGDSQALEGVKKAGGTFGPTVQRSPAGRPAAGAMVPVTPVVAQFPQAQVPAEQQAVIENYGRARATYEEWAAKAGSADAGPNVQYYAQVAKQQMDEAAAAMKAATPDFIG
jgi:hypothetical protein